MSEIEKYYNGEIHVDFDDEIEELKADIEEYRDSTTWWSNRFNAVERDNRELRKEIERLKSIIKEVREYIEENTNSDSFTVLTSGKITDIPYCIVAFEDILEILEKENKDGER